MEANKVQSIAIKEYLDKHPKATMGEICKSLDITYFDINRLKKEDNTIVKLIENTYDKEFKKIKKCLALNPDLYIFQVSTLTGIQISIIDELIAQGRLTEKNRLLKINDHPDKTQKEKETQQERTRTIREIYRYDTNGEHHEVEKEISKGQSKLVSDLKNLKNKENKHKNTSHDDDEQR